MNPAEFEFLCKLLKDRSGLVLTKDKAYLLENRLMPLARKRSIAGLEGLVNALKGGDQILTAEVVDAMTTNESFFFRDTKPFDQFKNSVLPKLLQGRADKKALRIWCAAASTGQEPYTLAMLLKEVSAQIAGWRVEIIGTDISPTVLERARQGIYTQFEVQRGLPIQFLVKYFKQVENNGWQIDAGIRSMVTYREFNLLKDLSPIGACDIVFCRNVLIYFDQATKGQVLGNVAKLLAKDGYLFLGGAETVLGVSDKFAPVSGMTGIYGLVGGTATSGVAVPVVPAAGAAAKPTAPATAAPATAAPATAAKPAAPAAAAKPAAPGAAPAKPGAAPLPPGRLRA
jgi:chemotaxis protein methyltransferase CheR